jgi:hypothetical protein
VCGSRCCLYEHAFSPPHQELAKDRFDPESLLAVFRRGRPTWLHNLAADPRGRRLILDLSAEHRSSIFLNYAIRRIFDMVRCSHGLRCCTAERLLCAGSGRPAPSQYCTYHHLSPHLQGFDDEVAAVGSSLSSYFEVYHRLLARRLELAVTASTPTQLERLSVELAEACAASQHTYAHAQHLLAHLTSSPDSHAAGLFRRLAQELEAAAAERHGGATVWAMQPLFVACNAAPPLREAVRLVSRVLVLGLGAGHAGGPALSQVCMVAARHGCAGVAEDVVASCCPDDGHELSVAPLSAASICTFLTPLGTACSHNPAG